MDPALKSMMHDTVQIASYQGHDSYGSPVYGTPTQYAARVERHFETQAGPAGQQLVHATILYLDETAVVDERSQLTLDGRVVPIQGLAPVKDELGQIDHYKVWL